MKLLLKERKHEDSKKQVMPFKRLLTEETPPTKENFMMPFKRLLTDLHLNEFEIDCEALSLK